MGKQSGRDTLENAIKYVREYIRKPQLFVHNTNSPEHEWQVKFIHAFVPHIGHQAYLPKTLLPRYIDFLRESWTNRKEGKRWTPPPPPQEIFVGGPPAK